MLLRRNLLVLPLVAALPAWAAGPGWGVSELRVGASGGGLPALARHCQSCMGVPVAAVALQGAELAAALNAGHVEAALLDNATLARARALMGDRLIVLPGHLPGRVAVVRQALPAPLRAALGASLA